MEAVMKKIVEDVGVKIREAGLGGKVFGGHCRSTPTKLRIEE